MRKLGLKIKTLRLAKGFNQTELASKVGLNFKTSVSNWENGMLPQPHFIPKLAKALGVEPSELAELWMADSLGGER